MVNILMDISVLVTLMALRVCLCSPTSPYSPPPPKSHCIGQGQAKRLDPRDKCWTDQGIELKPSAAQGSGQSTAPTEDGQAQNYVSVIITENTAQHCLHQKSFKAALECAMNYTVSCMPVDYRGYLPQPRRMAALVDKLCENATQINFSCAVRKMVQVKSCHYKKFLHFSKDFSTSKNVSTVQVTCTNFRFTTECLGAELRPCGCATTRLYETLYRDFLYPSSCPRLASGRRPAVCDVTNQVLFAENGSSALLILVADLLIYFAMFFVLLFCG